LAAQVFRLSRRSLCFDILSSTPMTLA
jgi:hypothetical protein